VLQSAVAADGYGFVHGAAMREMLAPFGVLSDWDRFAESWNDLALDTYMADGGRYRRRRHAVYCAAPGGVSRGPHQPHYQLLDYNPLNGGVPRLFAPVTAEIGEGSTVRTVLAFCHSFFGGLAPSIPEWKIEVHQFRIEARTGEAGRPTPEGLHRDGVDYVLVLLVRRHNVASGTTSIHSVSGQRLGEFTLTEPLDAALLDDSRVAHGVTAVTPQDRSTLGYRDVLVVTFAAAPRGL
jgi:hypothetical protein